MRTHDQDDKDLNADLCNLFDDSAHIPLHIPISPSRPPLLLSIILVSQPVVSS